MKCRRLNCPLPATVRVKARMWTGTEVAEDLCAEHGRRFHEAMVAKPQVKSGSLTPLAKEAA